MKFRLLSAHYFDGDKYLEGDKENENTKGENMGTVVGDGTPYPVRWPTLEMLPLDPEAEALLEKERERLRLNQASMNPIEELSMDAYEAEYVPAFNTRRREPLPDGAPVRIAKK